MSKIIDDHRTNNRYLNIWFLAIASSFSFVPQLIGISFYQTNDDVIILGRASGIFYGEPISDLIYVSPPLSNLISFMFSLSGSVSWYTVFLLATQSAAIYIYLRAFQENLISKFSLKKFFILILIISPIIIVNILFISLQYNQAAIFSAGIGTVTYLYAKKKFDKICSLILVFLAILWRYDSSIAAVGFIFILFFIYQIVTKKNFTTKIVQDLLAIALVSLATYSVYYLNNNDWSPWLTEEKKAYVEAKNLFSQIYGYESTVDSFSNLAIPAKKAGWSENDWTLFSSFYFIDQEVFSIEQQKFIAENRLQESQLDFLVSVGKHLYLILKNYPYILLSALAFTILIINFSQTIGRIYYFLTSWIFLFAFYYLILLVGERVPERIFYPFILLFLCSFLIFFIKDNASLGLKLTLNRSIIPLTTLLILNYSIFSLYSAYDKQIQKEIWWQKAVEKNDLNLNEIYYFESDKPIIAFSSFYEPFRKTLKPLQGPDQMPKIWSSLILIGWDNLSPSYMERVKTENLSADLLTSISRGDAYLATWTNLESNYDVGTVTTFLKENKDLNTSWQNKPFVYSDTGLAIWKVQNLD